MFCCFFFFCVVGVGVIGWVAERYATTHKRARATSEREIGQRCQLLGEHRGTKIMTGKWFSMQIAPLDGGTGAK